MIKRLLAIFLLISVLLPGLYAQQFRTHGFCLAGRDPAFFRRTVCGVEDNQPDFPEEDFTSESFEEYSPLDALGRCGTAYANVGVETMPDRGARHHQQCQANRMAQRTI